MKTETDKDEAEKTRFFDALTDQLTSQLQRDPCQFDTCIVYDVDLHTELLQSEGEQEEDILDILKNMRKGCGNKSTVSSMTLAELALVCASW